MKSIKYIGIALLGICFIVAITQYPKLTVISGYAAKNMASNVFYAKRTVKKIENTDHNIPLIHFTSSKVNLDSKTVTSSIFGLQKRKAIYRKGVGSVLLINDNALPESMPIPIRKKTFLDVPYPYGNTYEIDTVLPNVNYWQVERAIEYAFSNPEEQRTRSVLVLYKEFVIGEKYAGGITKETPILGWSMTKSILGTLYGILEFEGRINISDTPVIESWKKDDRKKITYNDLLRMQSGLAWEEDYTRISDVTRMLFLSEDMTEIQRDKNSIAAPGVVWNYSSGTSNLLSGMLRNTFNSYQQYIDFPYSSLIDRIGMNSMLIETDLAGNFVGSSFAWATTRDWGKLGLLYLKQGNWMGDQLFSNDWVSYVTTPTYGSDGTYGAHFWLNAEGKYPDVPTDLFSANGYLGQRVYIIPSKDLVIVRTGLAEGSDFDEAGFLAEVVRAVP